MASYPCIHCGHEETEVKDSRPTKAGYTRRRRMCSRCDARFTTVEVPESILLSLDVFTISNQVAEALNQTVQHFNALRKSARLARKIPEAISSRAIERARSDRP